jgi:hypothetical protein
MKTRYMSKHTKLKIYTRVIKYRVLHGCETRAMTEQVKSALKTRERKILRNICGPIKDPNGWRMRTNGELKALYKNQIL